MGYGLVVDGTKLRGYEGIAVRAHLFSRLGAMRSVEEGLHSGGEGLRSGFGDAAALSGGKQGGDITHVGADDRQIAG
jgi:hypothetical protein